MTEDENTIADRFAAAHIHIGGAQGAWLAGNSKLMNEHLVKARGLIQRIRIVEEAVKRENVQ